MYISYITIIVVLGSLVDGLYAKPQPVCLQRGECQEGSIVRIQFWSLHLGKLGL